MVTVVQRIFVLHFLLQQSFINLHECEGLILRKWRSFAQQGALFTSYHENNEQADTNPMDAYERATAQFSKQLEEEIPLVAQVEGSVEIDGLDPNGSDSVNQIIQDAPASPRDDIFLNNPMGSYEDVSAVGGESGYHRDLTAESTQLSSLESSIGKELKNPALSRDLEESGRNDSEETKGTLYDILGVSPTATRAEVKRRYLALAKETHPDAAIVNSGARATDKEFSEIAAAWRVLSDPKERRRYDRALQAEAFSQGVQDFAADISQKAAPHVKNMYGKVAIPFFRKATATTLASIQTAAQELKGEQKQEISENPSDSGDLLNVFKNAMNAAQRAGRLVDNLELLEQSQVLEERYREKKTEAEEIKRKVEATAKRRLHLALQVEQSPITSADAFQLLSYWNANMRSSFMDRTRSKHIRELEAIEEIMLEKQSELDDYQPLYENADQALQKARAENVLAMQAEKRAREALVVAQRRVTESNAELSASSKLMSQAASAMEKATSELSRMEDNLLRQRNVVRNALLSKGIECNAFQEEMELNVDLASTLEEVQSEEALLAKKYVRLEDAAAQLQSMANKLKERAQMLKDMK